ncbi:hypothetical protein CWB72_14055 [Pseudoalteromonas phenolica]|uniref:DUF4303 domain-containing protein n=1 Tax=Pseudoalteromonas phenolica TaxID=161398 RepID=UPI00110AECC1|nr:DUF4303 domain-containing protein [Pseudoalteromonas phenolica]TMN88084.1 hypothetical protein CWB72_14055 [Pseudoalteromonas phenolica]
MYSSDKKLEIEITTACRNAISELFSKDSSQFYYCCLVTTGQAHAPFLSAWSQDALKSTAELEKCHPSEIKWSYADSPYCDFGAEHFDKLKQHFENKTLLTEHEFDKRINLMEKALANLIDEGLFGSAADRDNIYINVEVMPPDYSNVERAKRLNSSFALRNWLEEAAEDGI